MSIVLNNTTITTSLWGTKKQPPIPKSNGSFLQISFDAARCGKVSCIAFADSDPTLLGIGTTDGSVFTCNLAKNKASLMTKLSHPISCISVGHVQKLYCASLQQFFVVNTDACRVHAKATTPHRNTIHALRTSVMFPGLALTLSIDAIAVWDVNKCECRVNSRHVPLLSNNSESLTNKKIEESNELRAQFVDGQITDQGRIVTVHATAKITLWDLHTLNVLRHVSLGHRRPASIAICSRFFAIAVDQQPEILCLTHDLEGVSSVQLPGSSRTKQVTILDDDIIAAQLTDGHTWFVEADTYAVSFAISTPANTPVKMFATAGSMYAVIATEQELTWYHLLAAKRMYDRSFSHGGAAGVRPNGGSSSSTTGGGSSKLLPFVRAPADRAPDVSTEDSESNEVPLPREQIAVDDDTRAQWLKVNLASNPADAKKRLGSQSTLLLNDVVKQVYKQDVEVSSAGAARGGGSGPTVPGTVKPSSTKPSTLKKKDDVGQKQPSVAMRPLLDHDSRVINMDKLRVMLMRYGVFPEKYRTIIWRFLMQLPDKRTLTPQFQALVEKGSHPATATLLEPFPLPKTKLRALLEDAIAAVCWNSPVLSVVHFTPNIIFPFVQLYGSDTQSAVEVFLSFIVNWGQEFFTYYPSPPVGVLSYISHSLKHEDVQLWNHLDEFSVGVDVWGWGVMQSLYTEVLTKEEWLQVMDHALSNQPLWLWCFHVQWVIHLREPLLQLHDHHQLIAMFRKITPLNLNLLIQQAYRLQQRHIPSPLSEPYLTLSAFRDGAYPSVLDCDEVVITSKLRELQRIAEHESEKVASRGRVEQITKQLAQAAMLEDAFVGKQRAVVTAKFDAANEVWVQQVQMEKERQRLRDVEHETRLMGIREQLRSAQRLADLQFEINAATQSARDAEVDRKREVTKWDFADRMTIQEMERLETGAKLKLQSIASTAAALTDFAEPENFSYQTQDNLEGDGQTPPPQNKGPGPSKPPLTRPAKHRDVADAETYTDVTAAVPRHDMDTMTELPPVPPKYTAVSLPPQQVQPPSSGSASAAVDTQNASSSNSSQQQRYNTATATASSTAVATESANSSCDVDPVLYYRQLQQSIQEGVERAQREQRESLAALESRFARQLDPRMDNTATTSNSDVTEAAVDEETTESSARGTGTTTTTSTSSDGKAKKKVKRVGGSVKPPSAAAAATAGRSAVTETTTTTTRTSVYVQQQQQGTTSTTEECSLLDSSTEGAQSNMTAALMRPPPSSLLQLVARDKQRGDDK